MLGKMPVCDYSTGLGLCSIWQDEMILDMYKRGRMLVLIIGLIAVLSCDPCKRGKSIAAIASIDT